MLSVARRNALWVEKRKEPLFTWQKKENMDIIVKTHKVFLTSFLTR